MATKIKIMQKQKVFIPIEVEKELPKVNQWYFTYTEDECAGVKYPQSLGSEEFNTKTKKFEQEEEYYAQPSHWLKEKEGYFFTADELIEMRGKDYRNGYGQRGANLDEIETPEQYVESLNIK